MKKFVKITLVICVIMALFTCLVACGENADDSAHEHSFRKAYAFNSTHHWQTCIYCEELKNYEPHTYGEWEVLEEATVEKEGLREHICDACGYKETEVIEKVDPSKRDINTYIITWLNYDGTVLRTDKDVVSDTIPSYKGDNPTREGDDTYSFVFTGWAPEITKCREDATYTAQFDKVKNIFANSIELSDTELTMYIDDTYQLSAEIFPHDTFDKTITWESDRNEIVEVSENGLLNAKTKGSVIITARSKASNGIFSKCYVTVIPRPIELFTYEKIDGKEEYSLVAYSGSESEVTIPTSYQGLPVTDIAAGAFRGNVYIEKVIIPSTVQTMGSGVFKRCESLHTVTLPVLLDNIPKETFAYCSALQRITVPATVEKIGEYAFQGTSTLSAIELPDGLTEIEAGAFMESGISTLIVPATVETIGKNAFCYASNLRTIKLSTNSEFTKIEESAFEYCRSLTRIEIPENVTYIDKLAFNHCYSLQYMTVAGGLEYIGEQAFYDCSVLESVQLGNTALLVEEWAFARCPMLKTAEYSARLDNIVIEANNDSLSDCAYKIDEQPATCTESGYQHTYYFNGTNARTATYEPLGHTGGTASCAKLAVCTRCGASYGSTDPANHDFDDVVIDPTCLTGGYTIRTCKDCGHTEQAKPTQPLGHTLSATVKAPTCSEGGYTTYRCLNCDYEIVRDRQDPLGHVLDTKGVCTRCGEWSAVRCNQYGGETETDEGYILFGEYPQTLVTDNVLISQLNRYIPLLPTADNYYNWTPYSYGNFINGNSVVRNEVHMWYFDYKLTKTAQSEASFDTYERYRAVYFDEYRAVSPSQATSYQEQNGYEKGKVYWFKYDRLIWQVLSEMNGEAHVLCTSIVDFQPFFENFTLNGGNYYNVGDEIPAGTMANDYEYSYIRQWLLNDFYNTAFSQLQRERLKSEKISVDSVSGKKALGDKVTLLSTAMYEQYGIGNDYNNFKVASDYALCQQGFDGEDKYDNEWYLYNPENIGTEKDFNTNGKKVMTSANFFGLTASPIEVTSIGIVPECWVTLVTTHVCKFNQEIVNQKALKSAATCTSPAVYYKSCTCGKCSIYESDTFEYGLKSGHRIQDGKCVDCGQTTVVRCNSLRQPDEEGGYVLFGSFPQTKVTEQALLTSLINEAGAVPVEVAALQYDRKGWTPYDFYVYSAQEGGIHSEEYAWYKDIEYMGEKYRAVYFNKYRQRELYDTTNYFTSIPTRQVIVFKFEPILWRIVRSNETTFTVVSHKPVDILQYTLENTKATTQDGKTEYYPADWDFSYLRTWLNETFYYEAFNELESENIIQTNLRTETANRGTIITKDNVYLPDKAEIEYMSKLYSPITSDSALGYAHMMGEYCSVTAPLRGVADGSSGMNINVVSETDLSVSSKDASRIDFAVHPEMVIHVCSFDKQIQDERYLYCQQDCTHTLTYYKTCECGALCLNDNYIFSVGEPLGHTLDESGKCTNCGEWSYVRCNEDGTPNKTGEYIQFGEYPSEFVRNLSVETRLNSLPAMSQLPSKGHLNDWTPIENVKFSGDRNTGQAAYYDYAMKLPNETIRYRAVYFSACPDGFDNTGGNVNGFALNKVYWFKYEPILWKIYDLKNGKANLVCVSSIDAMAASYTINDFIHYDLSFIKEYLNEIFIGMAFNNIQKEMVTETTLVKVNYASIEYLTSYSTYAIIKGLKTDTDGASYYVLNTNGNVGCQTKSGVTDVSVSQRHNSDFGLKPMISVVLDKNHICDYSREKGIHVAEERYLKSVASCTQLASYYVSCTCGSCSETETFSYGDYAEHNPTEEIVKDSALVSPANCTSPAIYYKSCANCDTVCPDPANTFTYGDPVHNLGQCIHEEYVASEATCTEPKKYYLSCKCGIACNTNATFSVGEPLGHNFVKDTCTRCGLRGYYRVNAAGEQTEDGEYVMYGSYPTSRVTDSVLLNELDMLLNEDIKSRYIELEYVENTGVGYYNTQMYLDSSTVLTVSLEYTDAGDDYDAILGTDRVSLGSSSGYKGGYVTNWYVKQDGPVLTNDSEIVRAQTTAFTIAQNEGSFNAIIYSGEQAYRAIEYTGEWTDNLPMYIFAKNRNNTAVDNTKARIYSVEIRNSKGYYLLKPYLDLATGDVCLCDLNQRIFLHPILAYTAENNTTHIYAGPFVTDDDNLISKIDNGTAYEGHSGSFQFAATQCNVSTRRWYTDIEFDGDMYRALYMVDKKSEGGQYNYAATSDMPNGYELLNVYWFKYEPVKWAILNETDTTLELIACNPLEVNMYSRYWTTFVKNNMSLPTNNWEYSYARTWMNEDMYEALFMEYDDSWVVQGTDTVSLPTRAQAEYYLAEYNPGCVISDYMYAMGSDDSEHQWITKTSAGTNWDLYGLKNNSITAVQMRRGSNNLIPVITINKIE